MFDYEDGNKKDKCRFFIGVSKIGQWLVSVQILSIFV